MCLGGLPVPIFKYFFRWDGVEPCWLSQRNLHCFNFLRFFAKYFMSFCVFLSSLASGSLRCPFGVMRDGPHVGKIRSRDPPRHPWQFIFSFFAQLLFSDLRFLFHLFFLGFSFLWTRVPQLAALALHSSPKVGIIFIFCYFFFWLGKLLQCGKYLPALYGRKSIH